jgi:DUF1680 family protein
MISDIGTGRQLDIKVRVPQWATRGFFVRINGQPQSVDAIPGTYLTLSKAWKAGDTIELKMPFSLFRVSGCDVGVDAAHLPGCVHSREAHKKAALDLPRPLNRFSTVILKQTVTP